MYCTHILKAVSKKETSRKGTTFRTCPTGLPLTAQLSRDQTHSCARCCNIVCVCVCRSTKVAMFSWLIGRCPEPKSECGNRVPLKPQQQQQNAHHLNPKPVHCSPMPRACLSVIANRNEHTEHSMPGFLCVRVCVRVRACPSLPSWFSGSTLRCDELTAQFSCTTAAASRCVCV